VIQQGQVFKLKAKCADGEPLWAYRYRVAGRGSARLQVGGFGTRAEAQRALQNKLARLLPGRRSATLTLGEWVEEYLDTHQGDASRSRSSAGCSGRRPPSWKCALPSSRRSRSVGGGSLFRKGTASRRPRRSGRC
jgi:hypothetical protein